MALIIKAVLLTKGRTAFYLVNTSIREYPCLSGAQNGCAIGIHILTVSLIALQSENVFYIKLQP